MSYYNVDAILAEEELVPISPLFSFDYLAHLDPDYTHSKHKSWSNDYEADELKKNRNVLVEGTHIKMPLWSIKTWAETGFVKMVLPRHFRKRMQDRLRADAVSVDLCKKSERYFLSGIALIELINNAHTRLRASSNKSSSSPFSAIYQEAQNLKHSLVTIYIGSRFRKSLDWTFSYHNSDGSDANGSGIDMEDSDFSNFTKKLDVMETHCLNKGHQASRAYKMWKVHGNRRIKVSESALRSKVIDHKSTLQVQKNGQLRDEGKRRSPDTVASQGVKKMKSIY